jgi:hypothetical protein
MTLDSIEKVEASSVLAGIVLLASGALWENPRLVIVSLAAVSAATVLRLSRRRRKDVASEKLSSNDPQGGGIEEPNDSTDARSVAKKPATTHSEHAVTLKKKA